MVVEHKHIVISKRLVAINSASSLGARVVNFLVLLWVYQYLLRHLSAAEFAVLPLVTSLMVFGPLFFSFFTDGIARYMIDAYAKGDFVEMRRVSSSLFPVLLGFSAVVLPIGLIFAANIENVFNVAPDMTSDAQLMMGLLMISFTFQMIIIPFTASYTISQRYVERSLLQVGRDVLRAILTVGFLLYFGPQVLWVVVATFVSASAMSAIMLLRSFRIVPELWLDWHLFSLTRATELMSFGLWTTIGRLGTVMYTHAATLVLNLYGSAVDVTAYHIAATIFRQTHTTVQFASMPLQPVITAMNALEDRARLASTVFRGGRYALWFSMLFATPLMIYADVFIGLYLGPDYSSTSLVIVLFMIMFPFTHPTALLPITAMATKEVRAFYLPAFLFQLLGLLLMLLFARELELGAVGVTLALTLITILSQLLYFWGLCLRLTQTDFSTFAKSTLVRGLAPAALGGVVWGALRLFLMPDTWSELVFVSAVGAGAYVMVLFAFCLDAGERRDLKGVTKKFSFL